MKLSVVYLFYVICTLTYKGDVLEIRIKSSLFFFFLHNKNNIENERKRVQWVSLPTCWSWRELVLSTIVGMDLLCDDS